MAEGPAEIESDTGQAPLADPPRPRASGRPRSWAASIEQVAKAVPIACDARKLILAAVGLLLLNYGLFGIDWAFGIGELQTGPNSSIMPIRPGGGMETLPDAASAIASPFYAVSRPFADLLDPAAGILETLRAGLSCLWVAFAIGLTGGAIARVAATDIAGGSRPGLVEAARFAIRHGFALIAAPLCPLIGIGFFVAIAALVGLLYWIPGVGPTLGGVLGFIPLLAGLVIALLVVGLAVGWPLMVSTVAVEGEDTFDALSRSYGYIYQRPIHVVVLGAIAWASGTFGYWLVRMFADLVVRLTTVGLTVGGPGRLILDLYNARPSIATDLAAGPHLFWLGVVDLLASSWIWAFLWSSAVAIYLMLRRTVDGDAIEEITREGENLGPFIPEEAPSPSPEVAPTDQPNGS